MTGQFGFRDRIDSGNTVLKTQKIIKGEHKLYYKLNIFKQKGSVNILNDISEHVALVQLMYSLGNLNHAISVVGYWIFDSNYEKALVLNIESLDIICSPSVGEKQVTRFEAVFYAVIYIRLT